jgi:hypothetical protein
MSDASEGKRERSGSEGKRGKQNVQLRPSHQAETVQPQQRDRRAEGGHSRRLHRLKGARMFGLALLLGKEQVKVW